jgi:hypothetical protein
MACGAALPPQAGPLPAVVAAPPTQRPLGVTLLAVLDMISGALLVLAAFVMLALGAVLGSAAGSTSPAAGFAGALFAVLGLVLIPVGALGAYLGLGLWRGRGWAWTVSFAFALLGVPINVAMLGFAAYMGDLSLLASSLFGTVIGVFMLWYWTREGVKRWFGKVPAPLPPPSYVPPAA